MAENHSLELLVQALRRLPGVGVKSAQRMAFHLLQHDRDGAVQLARALEHAAGSVKHCNLCHLSAVLCRLRPACVSSPSLSLSITFDFNLLLFPFPSYFPIFSPTNSIRSFQQTPSPYFGLRFCLRFLSFIPFATLAPFLVLTICLTQHHH